MSLLYTALTGADEPTWKRPNEAVYRIDSGSAAGKIVCVTVSQAGADLDGDGVDDEVRVQVVARMADETTGETIVIGNRAVETKPHNSRLVINQAEGEEDMAGKWLISCYDEAIPRALNLAENCKVLALIPVV